MRHGETALDNRLSYTRRLRSCTSPGRSPKRSVPCYALVSNRCDVTCKTNILYGHHCRRHWIYDSNAFYSSLSTASKDTLICLSKRGVRAIFRAPPRTPSLPLFQQLQICRLPQRMGYKLLVFTYRCTHSLTSTLLTNEFSVLGQSNARTQSTTRGQSFISLSLKLAQCLSPLWYNLSSPYLLPFVELSAVFSAASRYWFLLI